nr:MAG TPA: hypothetical protein [Caudoviricetes sp.]
MQDFRLQVDIHIHKSIIKPLTIIYSIHSHIIHYNTTIYCML